MKVLKSATILVAFLMMVVSTAHGQQFKSSPEAYKACEGKTAGDASQFVSPHGKTVKGICKEVDGKLILERDRPKENSGRESVGPRPEAYKACEGKSVGDVSQFVSPHGKTVKGICKEVDGKLILERDRPGKDNGQERRISP